MPDVRVLGNVGIYDGLLGKALLYAGKTVGGSYFFALKSLESSVEKWRYYRKSRIEAGLSSGEIKVADNLNMSLFTDVEAPDFAPAGGAFPEVTTIVNGATVPRLYNLENPYTVKGEGVTTAEIDSLKTGTTTTSGNRAIVSSVLQADGTTKITYDDGTTETKAAASSGALGGLIPTDFSALFSNPLKFIQDNALFVAAVIGVIYFIRRKKKKPLWII